jgi:hypothetical protein
MKAGRKTRTMGGPIVVVCVVSAALIASVGTCSRLSGDHPTSRDARVAANQMVEAVFTGPSAARIRPGMLASWRTTGATKAVVGRVFQCEQAGEGFHVTATFSEELAGDPDAPGILTIDTSLPPEVLK